MKMFLAPFQVSRQPPVGCPRSENRCASRRSWFTRDTLTSHLLTCRRSHRRENLPQTDPVVDHLYIYFTRPSHLKSRLPRLLEKKANASNSVSTNYFISDDENTYKGESRKLCN